VNAPTRLKYTIAAARLFADQVMKILGTGGASTRCS
jgi:hypothetical protein